MTAEADKETDASGSSEQSLRRQILLACRAEVLNAKPGNVTPRISFTDSNADDFLKSAEVVAPILSQAARIGVGKAILEAVAATQQAVQQNTNLGIVLLIAPLAAVPKSVTLTEGITGVLDQLTVEDAEHVYRAIHLASPGGLGEADEQDTSNAPTETLKRCMELAADRDLIAAQYANGFRQVLEDGRGFLDQTRDWDSQLDRRIAWVALRLMENFGDSLIARKNGTALSDETRRRASSVLNGGWPFEPTGINLYADFDRWLRDDAHRRNPGTTADLVAAVLFAAQRESVCRVRESDGSVWFADDPISSGADGS